MESLASLVQSEKCLLLLLKLDPLPPLFELITAKSATEQLQGTILQLLSRFASKGRSISGFNLITLIAAFGIAELESHQIGSMLNLLKQHRMFTIVTIHFTIFVQQISPNQEII